MACDRHSTTTDPCYMCRLEREMARFMPRDPSYRYWTDPRGWMYCWTTERMGDGKFAAFIYRPIGKGSRSGKTGTYKLVKEVHFAKRSTAKRHAEQWYDTAQRRLRADASKVEA